MQPQCARSAVFVAGAAKIAGGICPPPIPHNNRKLYGRTCKAHAWAASPRLQQKGGAARSTWSHTHGVQPSRHCM
jgi:hypothetical protein